MTACDHCEGEIDARPGPGRPARFCSRRCRRAWHGESERLARRARVIRRGLPYAAGRFREQAEAELTAVEAALAERTR